MGGGGGGREWCIAFYGVRDFELWLLMLIIFCNLCHMVPFNKVLTLILGSSARHDSYVRCL